MSIQAASSTMSNRSLEELEEVIERGLETFVEVGEALLEIRDGRKYRERGFQTFEDYCRERWGFTDRRARQLMTAAEVGTIVPVSNEGQARELVPFLSEPEILKEAWDESQERAEVEQRPVTAALVREVVEERRQTTTRTLGSSESDEWYTPLKYIEAARRVMGDIDLDPASCAAANAVVLARNFYSIDDDGLTRDWRGRVFMNPPFGREGSPRFVAKLLREFEAGHVTAAVLLCAARLETNWFHPLFDHTLCFPDHRVRFWQPGKTPAPPFTPAFAYLGPDRSTFAREFSRFGAVVARV